jgi:hypothetical protein
MHREKAVSKSCQKAYLSSKSEHNSSNLTLVRVVSMCFGPSAVAVMKGKLEKQKAFLSDHAKERDPLIQRRHRNRLIATYLILSQR